VSAEVSLLVASFPKFRKPSGTKFGNDSATNGSAQVLEPDLKSRELQGRVVVSKDRLFLRGNFTGAKGSRKDFRIPQGLPAHKAQIP